MLIGKLKSPDDIKEPVFSAFGLSRFEPGNFEANLRLVEQVAEMAKANCMPAKRAINWKRAVSRHSGMPTIIPISDATMVERVNENSRVVDLTDDE
ncbi:hypothetical protein E0Z10_g8689 [Xylaria hypoxylon]|uniref:NADP-dependent oxidoreductase domain-containing protein n=1 Tax=Xylaria hypoxylon TaxID=37992 RepID=A0A4Z0YN67_9PEZI|nr:hypothetical protein E0Z10_g8689 [Xylaria hypoxylon]